MSQVDGLSPERVMEIYYDMTGAGTAEDADYVYEVGSDGAESVHESDRPTDTAALGVSAPDMFPMNHPYAPSNQMAAAARDEGFSASDELGVEEMTAMILNVSTVLCCRQEDAALYLKVRLFDFFTNCSASYSDLSYRNTTGLKLMPFQDFWRVGAI